MPFLQDLMGKIAEKFMGEDSNFPAFEHGADIPSYLCIIDTLQRLGVDRYFQSEIDTILKDTYRYVSTLLLRIESEVEALTSALIINRLWQQKEREIFSDIFIHAMAFRLLRVKGYEVSSGTWKNRLNYARIQDMLKCERTFLSSFRGAGPIC